MAAKGAGSLAFIDDATAEKAARRFWSDPKCILTMTRKVLEKLPKSFLRQRFEMFFKSITYLNPTEISRLPYKPLFQYFVGFLW